MVLLDYYNVTFERSSESRDLVVKGEVKNHSGTSFNAVAIRIILFAKNIAIANIVLVVNNLPSGATKVFEKRVEELNYDQVHKDITRYEICTESVY